MVEVEPVGGDNLALWDTVSEFHFRTVRECAVRSKVIHTECKGYAALVAWPEPRPRMSIEIETQMHTLGLVKNKPRCVLVCNELMFLSILNHVEKCLARILSSPGRNPSQ